MQKKHITKTDLSNRIIDIHTHVGLNIAGYVNHEFPYCQSIEGLYYRQKANNVTASVVFPFTPHLFFDLNVLTATGKAVPAEKPLSPAPFAVENTMLFAEIFRFCPEYQDHFLPFVMVDPGRMVEEQIEVLHTLEETYPIYGIKIAPVLCQSRLSDLLDSGSAFLDFAESRNLPFLFHVTTNAEESYSQVSFAFSIIEQCPKLRFCLAHCASFDREYLERIDTTPNVWFDTSALKIQVQLADENSDLMASVEKRYPWNYADHIEIMKSLMDRFPDSLLWGSDSPAYSYICRRLQGENNFAEFRLKANYEDEKAALDGLSESAIQKASNSNSIAFLFGEM
jgi:predicted TIM-barrel fold metal-dependent hydrolase